MNSNIIIKLKIIFFINIIKNIINYIFYKYYKKDGYEHLIKE